MLAQPYLGVVSKPILQPPFMFFGISDGIKTLLSQQDFLILLLQRYFPVSLESFSRFFFSFSIALYHLAVMYLDVTILLQVDMGFVSNVHVSPITLLTMCLSDLPSWEPQSLSLK